MDKTLDACDFCGCKFLPLGSETSCRVCGAPRARWDSYRPAIVSDEYVLSRKGIAYGSNETTIHPMGSISTIVVEVPEPVSIEEIALDCFDTEQYLRFMSVHIGELSFLGSPVRAGRLALANLRTVLRDRVLLPKAPLLIDASNSTISPIMVSMTVVGVPLGKAWNEFVEKAKAA